MKFLRPTIGALIVCGLTANAYAGEEKHKYCSIAGYLYGGDSQFVASLAATMMLKDESYSNNRTCTSLYLYAKRLAEKWDGNPLPEGDHRQIAIEAAIFKSKIEDAILKSAGLL